MIKSLHVRNLNGKINTYIEFHSDLNILTGMNGSGKTTIMKLMWYLISGNADKLFDEMYFDYAKLELHDGASISLEVLTKDVDGERPKNFGEKRLKLEIASSRMETDIDVEVSISNPERLSGYYSANGSIFFPTFRRIEGGFAISKIDSNSHRLRRNNIKEALDSLTNALTFSENHRFVASVSTQDIEYLINNKYAEMAEEIWQMEKSQSQNILKIVGQSNDREKDALHEIRNMVQVGNERRNEILRPLTVLSDFVKNIFKDKKIKISNHIELGFAKDAIFSDKLSAGEKQMLGFLCYNFFVDNCVIFIDEPELSLHTDWQRILFPTLLQQKTTNQFIVATHSPFIYTRYEDKEIMIQSTKLLG